ERHAQFDHVGPGARQALQDRRRGPGIGVACADIGHEPAAALALQPREARVEAAAHRSIPKVLATANTSLSPRPHMFITRRWSFGKVGASRMTWASACA